jgi:hypothetical protein
MNHTELSGFSQIVNLGRRGKRTIYRAIDEEGDEVVLMVFDVIKIEDSENRRFQWLGELLLAQPIRHFVSIVKWDSEAGKRVIAFKAPQGTHLQQITDDANGIAADFSFLLIRALLKCCADHHELGLNLGELAIDQVVITRQGPVVIPDFEFYLNQVSDTPEYDLELEMYWSTPGLRHMNNEADVAHLGEIVEFLKNQINDETLLQAFKSGDGRELNSVLEDLVSDMTNENPLQRPSAISVVEELELFVQQKTLQNIAMIDPGARPTNFEGEADFRLFNKSLRKLVPNTNHGWASRKNLSALIGTSVVLCMVAILLATAMNRSDSSATENAPSTEIATEESTISPSENTTNPATTVAMSTLTLANQNWSSIKENFLWSFSPEPIAVGNAVYAIASNQDLFPDSAPIAKLTNLVLAQWNGQGWVSIQTTDLKDDSPGLLNVMMSPSGETIFLYTRCCVGHPLDAFQTVPVNRIFTIRKGQLFDLINDKNLAVTNVPAFDVAFQEDSFSGKICIDPKNSSADFGAAGSCQKIRQIKVRLNIDGSEEFDYEDQEYEVSVTTPSIPPSTVFEEVSCNGWWIAIVAATTGAGAQIGVDQNPGSRYLAGSTCPSLTQTIPSGPSQGESLYVIYYGPYFDHESGSAKCRELGKRTKSECYVKTLSNDPADADVGYGPNN